MIVFSLYCVGAIAALIAYILNNNYTMGIVVGSALPSLTFALAIKGLEGVLPTVFTLEAPAIFYGAAFIGMTSKKTLPSYWLIGLAGLIFTFIYLFTTPYFNGFGGALGATSTLCFLPVYGLSLLFNKKAHH